MSEPDDSSFLMEQRIEIKAQIKRGVDAGLHLMDAAEAAGMSGAVVIANLATDSDFRLWFEVSRGRTRLTASEIPDSVTPSEMKEGIVRAAMRAGAMEKIGIIIALADPTTPEGKKDLKDFALSVMKDHLPRETKTQTQEVVSLTAEEAAEQLASTTKEIARLQRQIAQADAVYLEDNGPESPRADQEAGGAEEEAC